MFRQLATFAVCAAALLASGGAAEADEPTRDVHVLSLQVSMAGKQIMAPVIEMTAGKSGSVSIGSGDLEGYTLVVDIIELDDAEAAGGVGAHFVLLNGFDGHGDRILDDVLVLGGKRAQAMGEGTLRSRYGNAPVVLNVISHAIRVDPAIR